MTKLKLFSLTILLILVSGCNRTNDKKQKEKETTAFNEINETIFFGGDIITMVGDMPKYTEAVIQKEGKIVFTGSKEEALSRIGNKTTKIK